MEELLKLRTKKFAFDIMSMIDGLPSSRSLNIIANQLGRSASSVAANYRAACKARSHADFISKIGLTEEEADESHFWLELLFDLGKVEASRIKPLISEASELTAIFTASGRTAKSNRNKK